MRWFRVIPASAVTALALAFALAPPTMAATTNETPVYSFDLVTANTASSANGGMMASPGDSISVTGSGTFDPVTRTVRAKGMFVHYKADGTVACQGTWKATGFTSFTDFGSDNQGQEGGALSITVTHYCTTMGMTMTGVPMTVTSTVNAPPGYLQGTTVCDFTQPTAGAVVIQPEQ